MAASSVPATPLIAPAFTLRTAGVARQINAMSAGTGGAPTIDGDVERTAGVRTEQSASAIEHDIRNVERTYSGGCRVGDIGSRCVADREAFERIAAGQRHAATRRVRDGRIVLAATIVTLFVVNRLLTRASPWPCNVCPDSNG